MSENEQLLGDLAAHGIVRLSQANAEIKLLRAEVKRMRRVFDAAVMALDRGIQHTWQCDRLDYCICGVSDLRYAVDAAKRAKRNAQDEAC